MKTATSHEKHLRVGHSREKRVQSVENAYGQDAPEKNELKCVCGCGGEAQYLMSGVGYDGTPFKDDPACTTFMTYCSEAACELGLPFSRRAIITGTEVEDRIAEEVVEGEMGNG